MYNTTIVSSVETHEVEYIHTEEGSVTKQATDWQYEYTITDQLGNSRLSFADADDNGVPEVIQRDDYYPFGLAHAGLSTAIVGPRNMYLFNGQELQQALKLNWADHGYRRYDVQIGRWNATDPAIKVWESPYAAMYNNPANFGDYDGADPGGGNATPPHCKLPGQYMAPPPLDLGSSSSGMSAGQGGIGGAGNGNTASSATSSSSATNSSSQAMANAAAISFNHQLNYVESQQLPSGEDRNIDAITAAMIEFMEVMPIEAMSTMTGGSSTTPSSAPDPNQTCEPGFPLLMMSSTTNASELFTGTEGPIMLHVANKRDESTVWKRFKIILNPLETLDRQIETVLENYQTVYWHINADGDINLNEMRYRPDEAGLGAGAIRALRIISRFRSVAKNMIDFVRNSPLIKNQALREQLIVFYRGTASIGNGSSTAALLEEIKTGQLISKSGHLQKVALMRNWLIELLRSGNGLTEFEKQLILREIVEATRAIRATFQPGSQYTGPVTREIMKIVNKYPLK